jgi:NAD(P)-dependent dehydrogenase (short-subunit alcohol dehydrogenase family)
MNILFIGANAALTEHLIAGLDDYKHYVLGRTPPAYLEKYKEVEFIQRSYTEEPDLSGSINLEEPLSVVFCGIQSEPKLVVDLARIDFVKEFSENVGFSQSVVTEVLPGMMRNNFGRFIFIGSKISSMGVIGGASYEVIKSSQKGFSRTLAIEYARYGVTSNVIDIGFLEKGYSEKLKIAERVKLKERIPQRTKLDPNEIAESVKLILTSSSINGSVITVDQGIL